VEIAHGTTREAAELQVHQTFRVRQGHWLAALTMRTVARELGMATMSLYRYVADRDELEVLVVDHVLAAVDTTLPAGDWRAQVTGLAGRLRDAVREHPGTVPLLVRHRHATPASTRWIEATLAALTGAGFRGEERVIAQRTLASFLIGVLENEYHAPLAGPGTRVMAGLSVADHPVLAETAAAAAKVGPDEEYRRGLAIVLRGLVPGGGEVL
jgi:AcrR family transcriptional regulator